MESRPALYDLTRLSGRLLSPTPGGIDRMDFAYAKHVLSKPGAASVGLSLRGPALFSSDVSDAILGKMRSLWEAPDRTDVAVEARFDTLRKIEAWLRDGAPGRSEPGIHRITARRAKRNLRGALPAYAGLALQGRSLHRRAPENAIYLNVSQFPLWNSAYTNWLDARPDVRCVAMIHDLLPLQYPEFFPAHEKQRHERRLAFLARRGNGAIVSTSVVQRDLAAQLAALGRSDMPIHVAHLPVEDAFDAPPEPDGAVRTDVPYFVTCGTIEPRKNHLMLLQLWREMVETSGGDAPRLIIVGRRGWDNETVFRIFDRSATLSRHVLEVNGLSTLELRHLLAGARALLAPSLAEGFGLPISEGRAAGAPVIASDIPVFREIGGPDMTHVHPFDVPGWKHAVDQAMRGLLPRPSPGGMNHAAYFSGVDAFLATL
ncbi:MAG TPA: glycosyltransferase family 1 protein [Rhodoblastus sp.]|nr:glycosyltransferase family 1 protein [Rhodoblastus sp.]